MHIVLAVIGGDNTGSVIGIRASYMSPANTRK